MQTVIRKLHLCSQVWPGWWFQQPGSIFLWALWTFRAGGCLWFSAPFPASRRPSSSSYSCLKVPSFSWRYEKPRLLLMCEAALWSELALRFLSLLFFFPFSDCPRERGTACLSPDVSAQHVEKGQRFPSMTNNTTCLFMPLQLIAIILCLHIVRNA